MIGCYYRVSTADQALERQLQATTEYARDEIGADLDDIGIYRDEAPGTNTDRIDYQLIMADVDNGVLEAVVVQETGRLARSLQDLDATVERIVDAGAELHFVRDSLLPFTGEVDPMARLMFQVLGAFAEWEARVKRLKTKEEIAARQREDGYHHGRPPLRFAETDGHLVEDSDYDSVVAVLDMVQKGEISKRAAARELECGRPTIDCAMNREELHEL